MDTPNIDYVEPAVGQIYKADNRDNYYQILYVDEKVVFLRTDSSTRGNENSHRIERRTEFDKQVDSGWFKHQPDSDLDMLSFEEKQWSEVDYIGAKTEQNLHENELKTILDIQQATNEELLDIGGLGEKGLQNLRGFAQ